MRIYKNGRVLIFPKLGLKCGVLKKSPKYGFFTKINNDLYKMKYSNFDALLIRRKSQIIINRRLMIL